MNAFYIIEIAFIGFTLHGIKQCSFFGTPGILSDFLHCINPIYKSKSISCIIWSENTQVPKNHLKF